MREWYTSNDFVVYMFSFPNGKKYIGITNNTDKRWANNGKGYKSNTEMYKAIQQYGWENVKKEILISGLTFVQARQQETKAIHEKQTIQGGYNRAYSYSGVYGSIDNEIIVTNRIVNATREKDDLILKQKDRIRELEAKLQVTTEQLKTIIDVLSNIGTMINFVKENAA